MNYAGRLCPLFPVERQLRWEELKAVAVDGFDNNDRREEIWGGFSQFRTTLQDAGMAADIYVGGSFVTEEPEPSDIDFTVVFEEPASGLGRSARTFLASLSERQPSWKENYFCDFELYIGHNRRPSLLQLLDASLNFLCINRMGPPQGTILVKVAA